MQVHRSNKAAPILEKKIIIFEKALELNPNSVPLLLGYLDACRRHWTPEDVLDKWKDVLSNKQYTARLWKEYLLFRQSQFTSFSVTSTLQVYKEVVQRLVAQRQEVLSNRNHLDGGVHVFYERMQLVAFPIQLTLPSQ